MRKEESVENGIKIINVIYEESDFYTEEEKSSIYKICETCEFKKEDSCGFCKCLLVNLISLTSSRCPTFKW